MPFGILDDYILPHVPGTVHLEEKQEDTPDVKTNGLKHGTGRRDQDIVLAPQPSDDPNDPLNWSMAKKVSIVAILMFGACIMPSCFGPMLSAGTAVIAIDLNTSIADVTILSGYQLLVAGCWGPFVSALSRRYGKRPQFLFASLMGLLGTIICSASKDYSTLRAGRVVQGFAFSAYESLIFSAIADLFYVHQRGLFTSIMSFTLAAVSNLTSVICGPITNNLGWHYLFHILVACLGFQLLLVLFFVPETAYERDVSLEIDETATEAVMTEKLPSVSEKDTEIAHLETTRTQSSAGLPPQKKTFWQELAIFTGRHSDENIFTLIAAPILVNLNVAALWMVVMTGAVSSFYVSQSFVAAQIFFYPPYNLTAAGVGYLFVGPFLGGLLGSAVLAVMMDPLILFCTKRNRGVYEPEFRLIPVILGLLGGVGIVGYATIVQAKDSLYLAAFFWGLGLFGIIFIVTPANSYVIDAYREISSEMFIANMMFKNFLFFGYSYFVNNWAAEKGPGQVFYVYGGLTFAMALTTLPIYVWGKRYRSYWCRHNLLGMMGIRTHAEL
ncbi:hypothetical protein LTR36_002984 [Oleoguttula mirabilis]|uniref:Major facilitator superfamily (MFS) profile domain-containing protein n=1 Tax=Oleoguttula mirabilis TaxID=1507867 RepID=A0AAV9JWT0_9PEZI|nr:hypothetical protein LTR36_002984 [Oleoguttula mirabilis]